MKPHSRRAPGTGMFAGIACAACCAPVIIAALGAIVGLAAAALFAGVAAAVGVFILGVFAIKVHRRRSSPTGEPAPGPVAIAGPARRSPLNR